MKKYFLLSLLIILSALCVPLISCGNDDDDNTEESKTVTITIENVSSVRGHYLFENYWYTLGNDWKKDGYAFDLYVAQEGKIWFVGTKHSNENALSDLRSNLTINVPVTSQVNTNNPYNIIAIDDRCKAKFENGVIVCNANLERDTLMRIHAWYIADMGRGYGSIAQPRYITAASVLRITNESSKTIKVRHKGFEAKEKWYYTTANVNIKYSDGIKAVVDGKNVGTDVSSIDFKIEPGQKEYVLTRFAPTGKKMTDACLILEIDGKEVKTAPVSSNISIENGYPYRMDVVWNGQKLELDKDDDE